MSPSRDQSRGLEPMLLGILSVGRALSRERDAAKLASAVVDALVDSGATDAAAILFVDDTSVRAGDSAVHALDDPRARACIRAQKTGAASFVHAHGDAQSCLVDGWTVVSIAGDDVADAHLVLRLDSAIVTDVFATSLLRRLGEDIASALRRIANEAALRATADTLRATFDLAPIGIVQTDAKTRRYLNVNERFAEITGYSVEELLNLTVDELTHPDDRRATEENYAAMRARQARPPLEKRYVRKDGRTIWVRVLSTLVDDGAGTHGHTLGMIEDITERRRAETLRRLQTAALDAAAEAIVITNTRGEVEWVNDAFCRLTLYEYAEIVGKTLRVLRSDRQATEVYASLWRTILAGEVWTGELVNRRKDGTEYDEEMTVTPVRDEQGDLAYFVAMKRDITERRVAERALAEAEELQRLALDAGEQGMLVVDLAGKTTRLDARAREHFGATQKQEIVASEELRARVPADDLARIDEAIRYVRTAESGGRAVVEHRIVRANGDVRWLSIHLRADTIARAVGRTHARLIGTTRDVTIARRHELDLRASEERYRALVDNLDHIIYSTDLDGRIVFVNNSISRFGFRPEDVIGLPVEDFIHPDERALSVRLRASLLAGGPVVVAQYRVPDGEGRIHYMRVAVRPRVEHERVVGVTGIAIDVTAQRDTEEQLRAAQKMEAVGRLAGGVAHDFNNLLSVILSYTELATLDLRADDPLRADLDEIAQAAKRAASLTRQLLAFSRRQLLQPEPLDLNELVSSLANMLRRLIGEDVELRVVSGMGLFQTKADRGQIEQVLLNLVVNARDAMPDGGCVTLSSSNVWLDSSRASATDVPPGAYVELTVHDTGVGMDAATRERIFEPFFTTKGVGKGTGLGLSMVYGIVRQSGGGIYVESEPGAGATFRIYLPRHEMEDPVPSLGAKSLRTMRGNECVLVVEDEAALRNVIRRTLTSVGYRVIIAANAAEALDFCTKRPDDVELVLTDVVMPGMSGRELAEQLVHICPTAKVIFMSGYTDEAIARHGVLGPGFLRKPFDRRTLTDTVRRVLDGHDGAQ